MAEETFITALLVTTCLLAFRKWGWMEWYQAHRVDWMPPAECMLCLGFWLAGLYHFPVALGAIWDSPTETLYHAAMPFCSTAISTYLIHGIIRY